MKTQRLHRTQLRLRPEVYERLAKLAYYHRMSMAALVDEIFANLPDDAVAKHIRW